MNYAKVYSDQILSMELEVFRTLDYNVGQPMSINFLRRYSNMGEVEGRQECYYDIISLKFLVVLFIGSVLS